ncbi:MAG: T9SS type A sorting domain-containing protein [Flavobacteriales bacterium]|nr:T9SS type A sorting domain-containing protein [Flavobacteriales bacterium]
MKRHISSLTFLFSLIILCQGAWGQQPCGVVYVSPSGNDGNPGTPTQPVQTLNQALLLASSQNRLYIRMENGNYNFSQPCSLINNVVIEGGYVNSSGNWNKTNSSATNITFTSAAPMVSINNDVQHNVGIIGFNVSGWRLQDLNITVNGPSGTTPSGRGRSVYGIWLENCSNYQMARCNVVSGNASQGGNGIVGGAGNGGAGGSGAGGGGNGDGGCGNPGGGANGAPGSAGGATGAGPGGTGGAGGSGCDPCGGAGFCCGECDNLGTCSGNGFSGGNGAGWAPGNQPAPPAIATPYFIPAGAAESGSGGGGGGQGGGGGGARNGTCACVNCGGNPAGGTGGAGGAGGAGGTGGRGGGGSFAFFRTNSNTGAVIVACNFTAGAAGAGGIGANGGSGSPGQSGSAGATAGCGVCNGAQGQTGASGGQGGNGGRGRDGANGQSGAQVIDGVVVPFTAPSPDAATISVGYASAVGCTNSEIPLTKNAGNWVLPVGGSYVNNLTATTTSYNNSQNNVAIYFNNTGVYNITANGTNFQNYLFIRDSRPLPTLNVIDVGTGLPVVNPVCPGTQISISTPTAGDNYEWLIYTTDPSLPIYSANTQNAGPFTLNTSGTFQVRLRVFTTCCGWSIPVYFTVQVSGVQFSYSQASYCQSSPNQNIVPGPGFTPGGTFSISPSLPPANFNSSTGTISSFSTIAPGPYTVTYTLGPCTHSVTVTVLPPDFAPVSYPNSIYCLGSGLATPNPLSPPLTGTWSSSPSLGAALNTSNGQIDLTTAAPGAYNILFTPTGVPCPVTSTSSLITLVQTPSSAFNYPQTQICQNSPVVLPTITGDPGGVFSAVPNFLDLNTGTGAINPALSPAFNYAITYLVGSLPCTSQTTVNIIINDSIQSGFVYADTVFCQNGFPNLQNVTYVAPATAGGLFTSTPAGLNLSPTTGTLNLAGSTPGSYQVTYTSNGACSTSTTRPMHILAPDDATFSYSQSSYCSNAANPTPVVNLPGGSFTASPAGLVFVNNGTGEIDLAASTPGSYTISYLTNGPCPSQSSQNITIIPADNSFFTYATSSYCSNATNPSPTVTLPGGTFTATPAGLSINPATGFINLATSTANTYTITYTTAGQCPSSSTFNLTVIAADDAGFSYSGTLYCTDATPNPVPTINQPGGTFSVTPPGLFFVNVATGEINLSASAANMYSITYTTNGQCPNSSSQTIQIAAPGNSNFSYSQLSYCKNEPNPTPNVSVPGGTFSSSPAGLVFVNPALGTINLSASAAGTYTITYNSGGACPTSSTQTITINDVDNATFSYSQLSYCLGGSNPVPTVGTPGGTFSNTPPGLIFANPATGVIDLTNSVAGSYFVTYTTGGGCPASHTQTVILNPVVSAAFSYGQTDFCLGDPNATPSILNPGGTFSSSPAGLVFLNPTFGIIDLTASAAGTYTVTYTSAGTCTTSATQSLTLHVAGNATFSYSQNTYCQGATNPTPTVAQPGGTFSSVPAGVVFSNPATGTIDLNNSLPGSYTIIYTTSGPCPASATFPLVINAASNAFFAYNQTTYCPTDPNPTPTVATPGGTFTASPAGLTFLNPGTGTINISGSSPNTYTITYNTGGACPGTSSQTITLGISANAGFSYSSSTYCTGGANPTPTVNTPGGTFSATPAGLVFVNPSNGTINLTSSLPNTYTVTYTTAGTCPASSSVGIAIASAPNASFSYGQTAYCTNAGAPTPSVVTPGGTFSASPAGLSLNAATGQINLASSAPGTYTITYTLASTCTTSATQTLTVNSAPTVTLSYPQTSYCQNQGFVTPTFAPTGGTFSVTPAGLNINSASGVINLAGSVPGTYTITYNVGGVCPAFATTTLVVNPLPSASIFPAGPFCSNSPATLLQGSPSGGTWVATTYLNSSGLFNPAAAGSGNHLVRYVVQNTFGCTDTAALFVTVNAVPTVTVPAQGPFCTSTNAVVLNGSPSGGTWSGNPFVSSSGLFSPSASGAGNFPVTYAVTQNGCTGSATQNIVVTTAPVVTINTPGAVCAGGAAQNLTGSPSGGTWSGGSYISSSGLFTPPAAPGTYNVTYTVTSSSCTTSATTSIVVNPVPNATILTTGPFCVNQSPVQLAAATTGGTWSGGAYISGTGLFNPSVAGTGSPASVTYTVTNAFGCSATSTANITVNPAPVININPSGPFCANGSAVTLTATPVGGTWSGSCVTVSGQFNPSVCGAGIHTVTYTATQAGCTNSGSASITVNPLPNAAIINSGPYCTTGSPVQLQAVTPGGTWSGGPYITASGVFNPGTAGVGSHTVTHSITQNGCTATATTTVVVNAGPSVSINPAGPFCANDPVQLLTGNPGGGVWSGNPYISSVGQFFPSSAPAGVYNVTYTVTGSNGCQATTSGSVTVHAVPNSSIAPLPAICSTSPPTQLNAVVSGGVWSGGLYISSSGIFNPAISGQGIFPVTYTLTDNGTGCSSATTVNVNVVPGPNAGILPQAPICYNHGNIVLTPFTPGGTFSGGAYVTPGGQFSPTVAGIGNWPVTYQLTGPGGCVAQSTSYVTVLALPNVSITPPPAFCSNDGVQVLDGSPVGGQWYGNPFVSVTGLFYPSQAGPGIYPVKYIASLPNGCTDTAEVIVQVNQAPNASINPAGPFCANESPFQLTAATNGGIFTGGVYVSSSGMFFPNLAAVGGNVVQYSVTDQTTGCSATSTASITVLGVPNVQIAPAGPFCKNDPTTNLLANIPGGVWYGGNYVSGFGGFNPLFANVGQNLVTYTVNANNGCVATDSAFVLVYGVPDAGFVAPPVVCENGPPEVLQPVTPGGQWSGGPYVNNGIFYPGIAGVGNWPVIYSIIDTNGCKNQSGQNIFVEAAPIANWTYNPNALQVTFVNLSQNATTFIWDFGDNSSGSVSPSPFHVYPDNGTYIVRLIAIGNCGSDTLILPVTVNKSVGLAEGPLVQFRIYPNPVLDDLIIESAGLGDYRIALSIEDIQGRFTGIAESWQAVGAQVRHVDVSSLPPGVYLLRLKTGDREQTLKIVKQVY